VRVEHPKRTKGRVSASTSLYVQSVVEHRGHRAPHGKPLRCPQKTLRSPLVAVWRRRSLVAEGGANES
jgi:hypothetical protein